MPDLKDYQLEDLFRHAAEKYLLKTNHAGWDEVLFALEEDESAPIVPMTFHFPCLHGMDLESMPFIRMPSYQQHEKKGHP